jgi:sulfotransferase
VEYSDLVDSPQETMQKIYEFLGENFYHHDFKNLKNIHQENDAQIYGFEDMHNVRKTIKPISQLPEDVLPQTVLDLVKGAEFWRQLDGPDSGTGSSSKPTQRFFGEIVEES